MTNSIHRAQSNTQAADAANRIALLSKTRNTFNSCWPNLAKLRPSEQRLVRLCQWSLKSETPMTDEQNEWLEEIAHRFEPQKIAA